MVARPHHATIAKAAKLGFVIHGEANDAVYTLTSADTGITLSHADATVAVEAAKLARMLHVEHGLKVEQNGGEWVIKKGRRILGSGETLEAAWEAAQDKLAPRGKAKEGAPKRARKVRDEDEGEGDEETDEDEGDEPDAEAEDEEAEGEAGKSIVKRKYRELYKPHKSTCGDEFQAAMREHLEYDFTNEKGKVVTRIDTEKLRALAEANDVWNDKYARLNPGQQRMNVGNRLRAKIKKGEEVVWDTSPKKARRGRK